MIPFQGIHFINSFFTQDAALGNANLLILATLKGLHIIFIVFLFKFSLVQLLTRRSLQRSPLDRNQASPKESFGQVSGTRFKEQGSKYLWPLAYLIEYRASSIEHRAFPLNGISASLRRASSIEHRVSSIPDKRCLLPVGLSGPNHP
jgi:hypothetical protein